MEIRLNSVWNASTVDFSQQVEPFTADETPFDSGLTRTTVTPVLFSFDRVFKRRTHRWRKATVHLALEFET
jgi:hypothetical protein